MAWMLKPRDHEGELHFSSAGKGKAMELTVPTCDNEVAGGLIYDSTGRALTFDREKEPTGAAFPCGHRKEHGSLKETLHGEVFEETGLTVVSSRLVIMRWVPNRCRRHPSDLGVVGHNWAVFRCTAVGEVNVDLKEARNPRWLYPHELGMLAHRTICYAKGEVSEAEWRAQPGLEPVWAWLLSEEGIDGFQLINLRPQDRAAMLRLAIGNQPKVTVT
jgi:8-oxo-dGTP pyrophosphatase MutT (NUDIX family)